MKSNKFILDACCGGRMFWFNKRHPNALYIDIRHRSKGFLKVRPNFEINPDEIGDFKKLKYQNKSFKLVVWDPPHTIRKTKTGADNDDNGVIAMRYGRLMLEDWELTLFKGFNECWRVLEDYGVLIFKWGGRDKKVGQIIKLFPEKPLFGHTTDNKGNTHWMCFMKIPRSGLNKKQ